MGRNSGYITPNGGGGMVFAPTYNISTSNGDQQLRNALPGLLSATAARTKRDMLDAFRRSPPTPRGRKWICFSLTCVSTVRA
jgi:hypothetical protein